MAKDTGVNNNRFNIFLDGLIAGKAQEVNLGGKKLAMHPYSNGVDGKPRFNPGEFEYGDLEITGMVFENDLSFEQIITASAETPDPLVISVESVNKQGQVVGEWKMEAQAYDYSDISFNAVEGELLKETLKFMVSSFEKIR